MYHFRHVVVDTIESVNARDSFDGPTYRRTRVVCYTLDAAVSAHETEGGYLGRVIHRMNVGRVTVRHI